MSIDGFVRRRLLAGCAGVLLLATGCGAGTTPTASSTGSPTTTRASADGGSTAMRDRLVKAVSAQDPTLARLISDEQTRLSPVPTPFLTGWTVLDVLNATPPHPRRAYVGLSEAGPAVLLSGHPDAYQSMLADAGVQVPDEATAATIATSYVDLTRDLTTLTYLVDAVADIRWRTTLDADQQAVRDRVTKTLADQVRAPHAVAAADGWRVDVTTVHGLALERHRVQVSRSGTLSDTVAVLERNLPVPYSS